MIHFKKSNLLGLLRVSPCTLNCSQKPFLRCYSGPSIKRYTPLTSPWSVWWAHRVPISAKYGSSLVASALGVTHIHPNTLITLAPPALAAAYFLYRRREHAQYLGSLKIVNDEKSADFAEKSIEIKNYNPADATNVLAGIENEFDSFRSQVIPAIRNKLVEYVMESDKSGIESTIAGKLLDENNQVGVFVGEDPETFVTSKAESDVDGFFPKFVTFSVPYFSSRNVNSRLRLGILQVSMLEEIQEKKVGEEEDKTVYKLAIQAWPYRFFSSPERIL